MLFARYDLDAARSVMSPDVVASRGPSMWRWFEIMPVRDEANVVTLGEGGTPLLRASGIEGVHGAREVHGSRTKG